MRRYFDTGLMAMLGLLMGLIAGNGIVTHHHIRDLYDVRAKVDESRRILATLDEMLIALQDAETGVRGYLITGERAYLEPYDKAIPRLDPQVAELRRLLASSPEQLDVVPILHAYVRRHVERLDDILTARRELGF